MPSFAKITALPPTKHARHERKQLECGSVNPEWKPRPSGKRLPKPDTKFFVAWDGEGIDTGATIPVPNGKGEAAEHILTLLACSDRKTARHLSRDKQRLTSLELLDFIGECVQHYGKDAIHVSFFFTYDASHIMRDIPRDEVRKAYTGQDKKIGHFCRYGPYLIKYIPRKKLTVERLRDNERETFCDKNGKWHRNVEWRATIWDVHGFFQGSFEKALKEWSIGTADQLAIIAKGKAERDSFHFWSSDDIKAYNDTENALLVDLMNKVKAAHVSLGLKMRDWNGAGASAAIMLQNKLPRHYIKSIPMPEPLDTIGRYAFAGGRIECIQQGTHNGTVYRYDINSAYPAAMTKIPDLHNGEWRQWNGSSVYQDFALYRVIWRHNVAECDQLPFYPFFWRDPRGYIYFSSFGENWVWGCELNAAIQSGIPLAITVHDGWEFIPAIDDKPFTFIQTYYDQRSAIKKRDYAEPGDKGLSLVIKLGLNSMYGKSAQKVGYNQETGEPPAFHNILICGWITAYTRAAIFRAAWNVRDSVVAFATDGIFTTAPIDDIPVSKALGEWEAETLLGLQIVQSGVYWMLHADGKWSEHSRGFDRSDEPDTRRQRVTDAWKKGAQFLPFTLRRFVASKYASLTAERWSIHCSWLEEKRDLNVYLAGDKRCIIGPVKRPLHRRLYPTLPGYLVGKEYGEITLSQRSRTPWDNANVFGTSDEEDDETFLED